MPDALLFISATGTNVGKTWVTRGLARGLLQKKLRVAAIKPIETGVSNTPTDALALGHACKRPELAHAPGPLPGKAACHALRRRARRKRTGRP